MATLTLRLPDEMSKRLDDLAEKTGRTKTYYAKEALERCLDDMEDAYLAESALIRFRLSGEKTVTHEELGAELGLGD